MDGTAGDLQGFDSTRMLIGGIWALISMRASLISGVRSGLKQMSAGGGAVGATWTF